MSINIAGKGKETKTAKLLKQLHSEPDNKVCMDCNTKGTTYIVLNFNIFVCTTCCGIQ